MDTPKTQGFRINTHNNLNVILCHSLNVIDHNPISDFNVLLLKPEWTDFIRMISRSPRDNWNAHGLGVF